MYKGYAFIRILLLILGLPIVITVLTPVWLARRYDVTFTLASGVADGVVQGIGALLLIIGVVLFVSSLDQILSLRQQKLTPWDLRGRLLVCGPYRRVRYPMVSGVLFILFGEALLLESVLHAGWALVFLLVSSVYIPWLEEPQLEARFGDEYRRYRRHVSRFLPRLRPWNPEAE